MGTLLHDLRFGARMLAKRPGFTAIAALALALGIGANTAIFSVVNAVLLRPLPYPEPERLVTLWETSERSRTVHLAHLNFIDWREQSQSFAHMSAYTGRWGGPETIIGGREPERAYSVAVYRDFFATLGVEPVVGRAFAPEEHRLDAPPTVVVSYGFWQRSLGGNPNLSDKRLTIGDRTFSVVGVMPPGFSFPAETDLWMVKEQLYEETSARSAHNYIGIARLKPGVTVAQAQAEMDAIAARLAQAYPDTNANTGAAVVSLQEQIVGAARPALLVLLAAVGFVLLIACANVANLLLARSLARQKEMAIRSALGAGRSRIVRQLLTESALLSLLGGALGLLLAFWVLDLLVALSPEQLPRINEVGIDTRTLLFALMLSLLTSLLFGLAPALRVSRPELQEALKEGGRSASAGSGRLRNLLVVSEVALTLVLLVSAGLLLKSFWQLLSVDPGFNPENVMTMQVSLPRAAYTEEHQTIAFHRQLLERIEALPGVEAAGVINNLPLSGVDINGGFEVEGEPDREGYAGFRIVSPGYFSALSIPLIRGRLFNAQDNESGMPVALISQRAANRVWPGEDPVGKRIRSGMDKRGEVWTTIIGIVGDVRHRGLDARESADLYVPYAQRPGRARDMTVVARASGDPARLISALREQAQSLDRNLPVSFAPMPQVFARSVADRRYSMLLLGVFAGVALLLSLMGIYGVMSYLVTERTREIGIRLALGAPRAHIMRLILSQGMLLACAGVGIGLAAASALTRVMASLLFGVSATDPATFAAIALLLVFTALLACYIPARRATKVDPMEALRYE